MTEQSSASQQSEKPLMYLWLTLAATWLLWVPAALLSRVYPGLARILHYAGGLMPLTLALILLYRTRNRAIIRDYWQRAIDVTRIKPIWFVFILFVVPVLVAGAGLFNRWLGGAGLTLSPRFQQPLSLIPTAVFLLFFGPVPEELAWRGYALDRLQARWRPLSSSLILGGAWMLWHLPLFFISGSYQHGLGVGTPAFWLFMLVLIPQTVVMVWVYNRNRHSTLSAILLHFMVNFAGEMTDLPLRTGNILAILWFVIAGLMVARWPSPIGQTSAVLAE